jgi:S-adenosylmethionine hydrolase
MHGVIAARDPSLRVIDVTHGIRPQDVLSAAYALYDAIAAFPMSTIFVGVVDPGVGSSRRAIAAEIGDWRFVGPDNGLLTLLLDHYPLKTAAELTNAAFHQQPRSATFHGRDIFAPVAAAWATGTPITDFGPVLTEPLVRVDFARPHREQNGSQITIRGTVVDTDHFGNLRTNIRREDFLLAEIPPSTIVALEGDIIGSICSCYSDAAVGSIVALFGSNNRLEIALCCGSAAARFPRARTIVVTLTTA